jgi:type IV secretion system protein VirB9
MKTFVIGAAFTTCLVGQALATQQPNPGNADSRVRNVNYDPANVVELWSTPGAVMVIQFADDEMVGDVAASDSHSLKAEPRANYLFFKFVGWLIPEPVIVLTKLPSGKLRRYALQVETHPQICSNSTSPPIVQASANGDPPPVAAQNLKHISADALGPDADVDYSVVFHYPGDELAQRRAAAKAASDRYRKKRAGRMLNAATTFGTQDPYSGNRNLRYMWRGDVSLLPRWVWDNGYSTAFVFPAQQRIPAVFRVDPDGKEATADYSVHGDTVIAPGTAREWRLRDGATVMEIYDLGYNPIGETPGTGTVSPYVQRTLKGGGNGG